MDLLAFMDLLVDLVIAEVLPESTFAWTVGAWLVADGDGLAGAADDWAESALAESEPTTRAEARASDRSMVSSSGSTAAVRCGGCGDLRRKGNPYAIGERPATALRGAAGARWRGMARHSVPHGTEWLQSKRRGRFQR